MSSRVCYHTIILMEKLDYLLFENPFWVIGVLVFIEVVMIFIYIKASLIKRKWILAIAPLLAVLFFAAASIVKTDREQIYAICNDIDAKLNEGKVRPLAVYVDKDFTGPYLVSDLAMGVAEGLLKTNRISRVKSKVLALKFMNGQAAMRVRGSFTSQEYGRTVFPESTVYWIKRDDGWKIIELTPPDFVNPLHDSDWQGKLEFPDR